MDLKKKYEAAKSKAKEHAPVLFVIASTVIVGGVLVYLNRQSPSNYDITSEEDASPRGDTNIFIHETDGVDNAKGWVSKGQTYHQTITPDEMRAHLSTDYITAYSINDNDLTFYQLSDPTD